MARGRCAVEECTNETYAGGGYCKGHMQKQMRQLQAIRKALDEGLREDLLYLQNNACVICNEPFESPNQAIPDHNHRTGNLRGLLCSRCNSGLGMFKDSIELLSRAIAYLEDSAMWYNEITISSTVKRRELPALAEEDRIQNYIAATEAYHAPRLRSNTRQQLCRRCGQPRNSVEGPCIDGYWYHWWN